MLLQTEPNFNLLHAMHKAAFLKFSCPIKLKVTKGKAKVKVAF